MISWLLEIGWSAYLTYGILPAVLMGVGMGAVLRNSNEHKDEDMIGSALGLCIATWIFWPLFIVIGIILLSILAGTGIKKGSDEN